MTTSNPPASPKFWRAVFRFKGIWNCVVTFLLFLFDDSIRDWLEVARPDPGYRAMFLALAFTFGLGYWRVSQDLTKNRDIVRGGIIGQFAVFAVTVNETLVAGRLPLVFLAPGVVDAVFAVLFAVFLLRTR
jgi:hypothetical protein